MQLQHYPTPFFDWHEQLLQQLNLPQVLQQQGVSAELSEQAESLLQCVFDSTLKQSQIAPSITAIASDLGISVAVLRQRLQQWQSIPWLLQVNQPVTTSQPALMVVDSQWQYCYLGRYWQLQQRIEEKLMTLSAASFSPPQHASADLQQAFACLQQQGWLAISGGAGTGKSTLALQLVNALLQQQLLHVALLAFTGKAVSRLSEGIASQSQWSYLQNQYLTKTTIHHVLAKQPQQPPRFHQQHCLPYDVIVVDEAAMLPWQLVGELLQATASTAMVIFMGDVNQLPAIEVGGFFSWLVQRYPDQVLQLQLQHRFSSDSPVQQLAQLALSGKLLSSDLSTYAGNHCLSLDKLLTDAQLASILQHWCQQQLIPRLQRVLAQQPLAGGSVKALSEAFDAVLISPWRVSMQGVEQLNRIIVHYLQRQGVLAQGDWVEGMLIVVRKNLPQLGLHNGDRGILVKGKETLKVRLANQERLYDLPPTDCLDLAFAMTVYQTQGSEFDEVLLWLGKMNQASLGWINPKLLYTAITRARKSIQIVGCMHDAS